MIEKCAFGTMTIDGRIFTSDLIILPDGQVLPEWQRLAGHRLSIGDIEALVAAGPEMVIVGMGIFGRMKPEAGLKQALAERGIGLIAAWTKSAAEQFNAARKNHPRVGACFHLTC